MSYALFVLYWPDFSGAQPDDTPYTPSLLVHSLKRQLLARYEDFSGYFWLPTAPASPAAAAFQRWGLRQLEAPPTSQTVRSLLARHPQASHVIFAMSGDRGLEIWSGLSHPGISGEVWTPAGEPSPDPSGTLRTRVLEDCLHLRTAVSVGLFADWHHLSAGLAEEGAPVERGPVMDAILRCAELAGAVVTARLYGGTEEERSPQLGQRAGGAEPRVGNPSEGMREDLLRLLEEPYVPQTWVLVTGAPWLPEIVTAAHLRDIRVLLWPLREEAVPLSTRLEADGYADLRHFLPRSILARARRPQDLQVLQSRVRSTVQAEAHASQEIAPTSAAAANTAVPPVEGAELRIDGDSPGDNRPETRALPTLPLAIHARLSPWVRLVYHVERALREYQAPRMTLRRLASVLANDDEFGPAPTASLAWLNRARGEGLLVVEQDPPRNETAQGLITCRPNPEHPVCRAALDVPDRILRLLRQMLQKMPWVSFKLLRSVLIREQWLGGAPFNLDECAIDEWINYLIQDGAIRMTKEPNLANPEYPVTALRLNDEHPLAQSVVSVAEEGARLAAERAILAVDHFMIRHRKPWMAMSALRRALDGMGREELQAVLEGLQNLGVLITESYPNPQKEHLTTGCRLKMDETIVVEALRIRNVIVRVTHQFQRRRSWVRLADLYAELSSQENAAVTDSQRLAWISLLRDEGLLELDHEVLPPNGWGGVRCRLNLADSVVRTIMSGEDDSYTW